FGSGPEAGHGLVGVPAHQYPIDLLVEFKQMLPPLIVPEGEQPVELTVRSRRTSVQGQHHVEHDLSTCLLRLCHHAPERHPEFLKPLRSTALGMASDAEMLEELRKIRELLTPAPPAPTPPAPKGLAAEFKSFLSQYKVLGLAVAFILGLYLGQLV